MRVVTVLLLVGVVNKLSNEFEEYELIDDLEVIQWYFTSDGISFDYIIKKSHMVTIPLKERLNK